MKIKELHVWEEGKEKKIAAKIISNKIELQITCNYSTEAMPILYNFDASVNCITEIIGLQEFIINIITKLGL